MPFHHLPNEAATYGQRRMSQERKLRAELGLAEAPTFRRGGGGPKTTIGIGPCFAKALDLRSAFGYAGLNSNFNLCSLRSIN